jgi:DNA-binding protein H-NS
VLAFLRIQAHRPIYISQEEIMARQASLASMSIDALVKLKDGVAEVLNERATQLRKQLMQLNGAGKARNGRKRLGRKASAKYRDPKTGETWSGRGGTARWLAAYEKQGRKRDQFLIAQSTASKAKKKSSVKKARKARRKKR